MKLHRAWRGAGSAFAVAAAVSAGVSAPLAQSGGEDGPRSGIPWLDDAVSSSADGPAGAIATAPSRGGAPGGGVGLPPRVDLRAIDDPFGGGASGGALPRGNPVQPDAVEIAPLDRVEDAAAGLLDAPDVGLQAQAWSGTSEARAVELTAQFRPTRLRTVNELAIRLLAVALEPPASDPTSAAAPGRDFLTERIDALMRFGAAEWAALLAERAGAQRLRVAADAALVAGRLEPLCRALLVPDEPASQPRIYCQILAGDQIGALIALEASRALGDEDEITLSLLEALAEPALADLATPPRTVAELTPLRLVAMRDLGVAPPPDFARTAPLALTPSAFGPETPPREILFALERLERSGALETAALADAYANAASAESGGVWGRVEVYRRALSAPPERLPALATAAIARAKEEGRGPMMARLLGERLIQQAEATLGAGAAAVGWTPELRDALRLSGRPDLAAALSRQAAGGVSAEEAALDRLATARLDGPWDPEIAATLSARAARGDLEAGLILAALDAFGAPVADPALFPDDAELAFVEAGQQAELAFEATALLMESDAIEPETLHRAMTRLIAAGLVEEARMIAVEAIISAH